MSGAGGELDQGQLSSPPGPGLHGTVPSLNLPQSLDLRLTLEVGDRLAKGHQEGTEVTLVRTDLLRRLDGLQLLQLLLHGLPERTDMLNLFLTSHPRLIQNSQNLVLDNLFVTSPLSLEGFLYQRRTNLLDILVELVPRLRRRIDQITVSTITKTTHVEPLSVSDETLNRPNA